MAGNQQGLLGPEEPGEGIRGAACGAGGRAAGPCRTWCRPGAQGTGRAGPEPRPLGSRSGPGTAAPPGTGCACTAPATALEGARVAPRARACAWPQSPLLRGSALGYHDSCEFLLRAESEFLLSVEFSRDCEQLH